MPQTPEVTNGNGDEIKVGSTGTINSLMSKELESTKKSPQPSSSSGKKLQDPPVSVPCGYSPRRAQTKKNLPNDPSSSSSSSNCIESSSNSPRDAQKPNTKSNPRKNEHVAPMLTTILEKNTSRDKPEKKKKGHTNIAEVVDLKCNSPMSSRLKKLGFSKLNESTI